MQYLQTHYGRSLPIPANSDYIIPHPAAACLTGETTAYDEAYILTDQNVFFNTSMVNNIIITADGLITKVVAYLDEHSVELNDEIISGTGQGYTMYTPTPHEGCSVYLPQGAVVDLTVTTLSGDVIDFKKVGDLNASMIFHIKALKVNHSSDGLIALW